MQFSPQQWGPIIDGADIFERALIDAYGSVGMTVTFIDDYRTHHVFGGEIHCGTNAVRTIDDEWWRL
ncbi:hypothetical protein CH260_15765 [Rhodococcus sp. 05-2256-B2]|uniref:protein-arginine deiminase family protein n=1 Tax=Nocardiaceae TaxID=85025 RepID=UPI0009B85A0D|nr:MULTISPECIES: protein-arginine deiminase family protein [Rhodococcus]MBY4383756.1 hypothetical protein [Rhodococcus fascians]MBY4399647.1 hypothetical protein [Rhodococcus fascians]MBY4409453.1 hypothetical protein [Rhodococcus fascians]MBY4424220.1 hypothetical protein [Rhodococcus fascians]MBY4462932.1 hypothetical protein [Rhodococcus fascians]